MTSKITVNDALISTDVDRLIRTISEKKKVDLHELEHLCNMDRRSIDKWVRVLEDEGYISISYGLTGTKVIWQGEEEPVVYKGGNGDNDIDEVLSNMPGDPTDPDRRLEEFLKKRKDADDPDDEDLKATILERLDNEPIDRTQVEEDTAVEEENEEKTEETETGGMYRQEAEPENPELETEEPENVYEPETEDRELEAENIETENTLAEPETELNAQDTEDSEPETHGSEAETEPPPRISGGSKSTQVKELVNAYINQINDEKAALQKLKGEKDRVYREKYLALESKVEADIASITERMLDQQGRILELKEKVLELPGKVAEVEQVHESVKKLETDGREILGKTRKDVEVFIADIEKSKEAIEEQIGQSRGLLDTERERVDGLRELSESIESNVESVQATMESTKEQMDELNQRMNGLLSELEEAAEMKAEIADMVGKVSDSIEEKEGQLGELEGQLGQIHKVEQWVREYVSDYERKVDQISEFVQTSDDDLAALRKSAEKAYVSKYLRELDSMTTTYDAALHEASAEESEIDDQIASTKARLSSLVKDSKEMIRKLRTSAPDFETSFNAVSTKTGVVLQVLEEKEAEREKLSEDMQAARSGRPRSKRQTRLKTSKPKTKKKKRGRPPKKKPKKKSSKRKGKKK